MKQQALDDAVQLAPDLWHVQNLLANDELAELKDKIDLEQKWQKIHLQENKPRDSVIWQKDGVIDWLWSKLNNLDYKRFNLKFRTVMIWRDHAGYTISNHFDNERVIGAMQIYISDTYLSLGTWFNDFIEIPFVQNSGYLMHNKNKIEHGMKEIVPHGYVRLSFYALFDQID